MKIRKVDDKVPKTFELKEKVVYEDFDKDGGESSDYEPSEEYEDLLDEDYDAKMPEL